jgi:hypothetical protein
MNYDFNSIETLILVRATLRKLMKNISQLHYSIVCQTEIKNLPLKLEDVSSQIKKFQQTDDYSLLCNYLSYTHCPDFFRHMDETFFNSLSLTSYTLQDILAILKKLNSTSNELEQEIININEKYF